MCHALSLARAVALCGKKPGMALALMESWADREGRHLKALLLVKHWSKGEVDTKGGEFTGTQLIDADAAAGGSA